MDHEQSSAYILMSFKNGELAKADPHTPAGWVEGVYRSAAAAQLVMDNMDDDHLEFRIDIQGFIA